jgi:hypothetical protein
VLALELPLSRCYIFPNPLICILSFPFSDLQVPFIRFQALAFIASYNSGIFNKSFSIDEAFIRSQDLGEHKKGRAQVWTVAFK